MLFPFHGKKLLFGVVAFLTSRNGVAFCASATPGDGHDMVHGEFFGSCRAVAVVAGAFGAAAFPPLRIPELSSLAALSLYVSIVQIICKWFHIYKIRANFRPIMSIFFSISAINIS